MQMFKPEDMSAALWLACRDHHCPRAAHQLKIIDQWTYHHHSRHRRRLLLASCACVRSWTAREGARVRVREWASRVLRRRVGWLVSFSLEQMAVGFAPGR